MLDERLAWVLTAGLVVVALTVYADWTRSPEPVAGRNAEDPITEAPGAPRPQAPAPGEMARADPVQDALVTNAAGEGSSQSARADRAGATAIADRIRQSEELSSAELEEEAAALDLELEAIARDEERMVGALVQSPAGPTKTQRLADAEPELRAEVTAVELRAAVQSEVLSVEEEGYLDYLDERGAPDTLRAERRYEQAKGLE